MAGGVLVLLGGADAGQVCLSDWRFALQSLACSEPFLNYPEKSNDQSTICLLIPEYCLVQNSSSYTVGPLGSWSLPGF